jgi:Caspase domain
MNLFRKILWVIWLLWVSLQPAVANAPVPLRLALVIGNASYRNAPLKNPGNDARAMKEALEAAGFKVHLLLDANRSQLAQALQEHQAVIQGTQGLSFIYYAGHGVQLEAENFILPVDVNIQSEKDIPEQGISVKKIVENMSVQGGRLNVFVLDACRDNPFKAQQNSRGFAPVDAPARTLVGYATEPGNVAIDGQEDGAHGLYTAALLRELKNTTAPIDDIFKRIKFGVRRASQGQQVPAYSNGVFEDVFFTGASSSVSLTSAEKAKQFEQERLVWNTIKDGKNPEQIFNFIQAYPASSLSELAQGVLERIDRKSIRSQAFEGEVVQNPADARFRNGDVYTMKISYEHRPSFTVKSTVFDVSEDSAKYSNVFDQGPTGQMTIAGAVISDGQNTFDPPYVLVPGAEYQVGKRWRGRSLRTNPKGQKAWMDYSGKVVAREQVTVPAGTFLAYRVEIQFQIEGDAVLNASLWVQPEWGLAIKTNFQFLDPNGRVRSGVREMVARQRG